MSPFPIRRLSGLLPAILLSAVSLLAPAQAPTVEPPSTQPQNTLAAAAGIIRGTVHAGSVPLPGVSITAANALTGKKYATSTDINGSFSMSVPRSGRYVVTAEMSAFAPETREIVIHTSPSTTQAPSQPNPAASPTAADFNLQLASRARQQQLAAGSPALSGARALIRGTQSLSVLQNDPAFADASTGSSTPGAELPTLTGMGTAEGAFSSESVAVSGQTGQTNGLAGMDEDEIRQRIQDAVARARQQGGPGADVANAVAGMIGGIMAGPSPGGGRGGGGGFRRFNPSQPHGSFFYQGGNGALDATSFSLTGAPVTKPAYSSNRFGITFAGSPYIPRLTKPSTKQFIFFNVTGARNITPQNLYGVVPTLAERGGDFSQLTQTVNGHTSSTTIYDPATGQPFANNIIPGNRISPQAQALLNFYPAPNIPLAGTQGLNYQTITTSGSNAAIAALRFVRNFGQSGFGGPGGFGRRAAANAPKTLRQNINFNGSYSHAASDLRNVFLPLGGNTATDGYGVTAGYTVGYGRFTNNSSVTWNRSHLNLRNYFTDTSVNPALAASVSIPSQQNQLANPSFYNGLPNLQITNFTSLNELTPRDAINQTISFSDFASWSHKSHNLRLGLDIRRVHADSVGGNNVVGTFVFSGYATQSPADQRASTSSTTSQSPTGLGFADYLLGLPQQTKIQAGLAKIYLRANVIDWYLQDDWRARPNLTFNYGLRYEYFSPYVEKNNRLVNLDHNADFTQVAPVTPSSAGPFSGSFPRSLVNPDRTMYSPRFGVAWRPKKLDQTVIRAGYGINYNTGQFATFAQSLAFQPPFAVTQTNVLASIGNPTGCTMQNMTLASGFNCSTTPIQNNYAVNKDYRLGRVQIWNIDVQRSLRYNIVLNVGYNGSNGANLDMVRAPNHTPTSVTTSNAQAFTYEDSLGFSRMNMLTINARKRMQKGIALQATYQYGHSIDNASSIGGAAFQIAQNDQRLDLEESNSAFDVRHKLTGNWVFELPIGPNRALLSKGGVVSRALDGFSVSGDYTFASGTYYTPQYISSAAQIAAGGNYTLRPDRVFSQPISGPATSKLWFNKDAFVSPGNGFGTASRNSIEGPGIVSVDMSLAKTVSFGETRTFETRLTASNAFNTVQYSTIDTAVNSATYGFVTSAAPMRRITLIARYRF